MPIERTRLSAVWSGVILKKVILLGLTLFCLAGCGYTLKEEAQTTPDSIDNLNQPRIRMPVTAEQAHVTKSKALAGLEGDGWVFDPLYATAVNAQGRDLAVCGFARQKVTNSSIYFAYYSGELLLSDEKAPSGVSVENEFLTMICSHS
ncbi:hypothetical protein ACOI7N_26415 [Pseudomonas sp. P2758]|uniref:hypothetical protein n=1 Tax=Pseudomonas sp. P2758 TaxID=3409916 RepID=UPI003B5B7171